MVKLKRNNDSSNVSFSKDSKEKSEDFTNMLEGLNLKEKTSLINTSEKENIINNSNFPLSSNCNIFIESPKNTTINPINFDNNYNYSSSNRSNLFKLLDTFRIIPLQTNNIIIIIFI